MFSEIHNLALRLWELVVPWAEGLIDWYVTGIHLPGFGTIAPINFLLGSALTIWLGIKLFKVVVTLS